MTVHSLIERLAVTGQAIRDQQQATDRLAAAMTQLTEALELSVKEAEASCMTSTSPDQGQRCLKPETDMDMFLPGVPSKAPTLSAQHVAKEMTKPRQHTKLLDMRCQSMTLQQVDCIESCVAKVEKKRKEGNRIFADPEDLKEKVRANLPGRREKKRKEGNRIFADPEDLKEKVRANLTREPYDVSKFYRQTGACQAIIRSPWFEMASLILVMVSSVWMAVDIDHNDSPALHKADPIFQVVAHVLCFLFLAELLVRLFAFQLVRDSLRDRWIVFDVVLVVLYVFETWILGITAAVVDRTLTGGGFKLIVIFRVLRLLRVLRLARVLQHLPELMVIIHGLSRALRAI
eukprot:CAMPEP_0172785780 /NCGR_PEP_ID=MMETSP1074-20121228/205620_1 /TAXON_ID=2916 /ORGANISM="Ceratium fusus, Strain PA161109" /LENGTH=345 /DNA_ID=CAMNT_0013622793 /DNA_START=44 /DNA_END=1079 /DNA_ORIENTATION=-